MLYHFRTYATNILRSNLFFGYVLCSNYTLQHSRFKICEKPPASQASL